MEKYKIKLEEEKKLLKEELATLGVFDKETGKWEATPDSELNTQEVLDGADMASRGEDYIEKTSTLATLQNRFNDVKDALSKIEKETYGKCEVCKMDIEKERLDANPSARTCESCINKVI